MATRHTKVTAGHRGLEDRGGPSSKPEAPRQLESTAPSGLEKKAPHEHVLQAYKTGLIVQLTSQSDRDNPMTGITIKGDSLRLLFAGNSGFVKLDLQKARDRRIWMYVVGSAAWEKELKALGIDTTRDPQDGSDPIPPHPRYGLGMSFWKLSDLQTDIKARKRETLLRQLAEDDELADLAINSPEELSAHLAERRAKLARPTKPVVPPASKEAVSE